MPVSYLENSNVHGGVLFADTLVEKCRAEGDERRGADSIQELAEVEEPAVPRQRRRELLRTYGAFAIFTIKVADLVTLYVGCLTSLLHY